MATAPEPVFEQSPKKKIKPLNGSKFEKKCKILQHFRKELKGKKYDNKKNSHCGSEGHWLEKLMGIKPNSQNEPDRDGYEQKKYSTKITFGDWAASSYLYHNHNMSRDEFIISFGSPNKKKNNRYSWSGKVFPKYGNEYNDAGQRLLFADNGDLVIQYLYTADSRLEKNIKEELKTNEPITIALWKEEKLKAHLSKKFAVNGFYMLKKNNEGIYDKICFGNTIDYEFFKKNITNSNIIIDSGMYIGNSRNYSQFRANNNLWNELITEEYS